MFVRIVGGLQLLLPVRRGSRLKQACAETLCTRERSGPLVNKSTSSESSQQYCRTKDSIQC